jgi:C1A family cysteine protease
VGFSLASNDAYPRISTENPVMDTPGSVDPNVPNHAVAAVAYDDERAGFCVRDSRGAAFAMSGHWWLPYSMLEVNGLIVEAWTVDSVTY